MRTTAWGSWELGLPAVVAPLSSPDGSASMNSCVFFARLSSSCCCFLLLLLGKQVDAGLLSEYGSGAGNTTAGDVSRRDFPDGFVFGTATAAYQVEGAVDQDGRGKSIWDTFSHHVGNIIDLSNGDVATNDYNRYKEDVNLMANMSVDAYRFSISWSRILPFANGTINQAGINHYNSLIDALLLKGIQPYVTLYHWDLPQALEDKYNGWLSSQIIDDYLMYAKTCFEAFGDRVKNWITFNEPYSFTLQGFAGLGLQAPGRCSFHIKCARGNSSTEPYIVAHHVLLAHAYAVALYRQNYQAQQHGLIGITLDSKWYEPLNKSSGDDFNASRRALDFHLGWFLDPIIFGDYPSSMKELVKERLPSLINFSASVNLTNSFDFIGINHYTTNYVQVGSPSSLSAALNNINPDGLFDVSVNQNGQSIGPQSPGALWLYVVPWGFKKLLDYIRIHYNNPTIIITENGYADLNESPLAPLERVLKDNNRIAYHKAYLSNLLSTIKEGSNVKGYFIWSLLDNWEWGLGFIPRFGLYFVDYTNNLQRYPKKSVEWFKNFLKN